MLHFQYIKYLLLLFLLILAVIFFVYAIYRKKVTEKKIGDKQLVQLLSAGHNHFAYIFRFFLLLISLALLVLAFANPRSITGLDKVNRNGIDVMIALDVSKSMMAPDITPTRLDRAKQLLGRLIDKLNNDRVGIVIFAGRAYLQMPLTGDQAAAKMYLNAATTASVPTQGTVISEALKMCNVSFNEQEKKHKAIILISDGEDHDENAEKTASQLSQDGVVIYTVGIGSPQGAPITDEATGQFKTDIAGNTVISRLNENILKLIAQKTNGEYMLFSNTDDAAEKIQSELSEMDQRNITGDAAINYKSYFRYFLLLALVLLLTELFISERKKKIIKLSQPKTAVLLLFVFSGYTAFAQEQEKLHIKKGNEAYKKAAFGDALADYGKVIEKNPGNAVAQFNQANALYRTDKRDEAIQAYDLAIKNFDKPVEKANAWYNKGVVLHNDQKLPECINAYKTALKLDPDNEDARLNLQKAIQKQKEEQQKQQKEPDKKKKDRQKEEKKPEPKQQQSRLTRKDALEKLKALMEQEKNLQDKLHKVNAASVSKPEKDW